LAAFNNLSSGRLTDSPKRIVIGGGSGTGKTTLAAQWSKPLIGDVENGSKFIDVDRVSIETIEDLSGFLKTFAEGDHDYETCVIDTWDWVTKLLEDVVVKEGQKKSPSIKSIGDFDFGKGYARMAQLNDQLIARMQGIVDAGYNVIVLCHTQTKEYAADPMVKPYQKHTLKMHDKISTRLREWADFVWFASHDIQTQQTSQGMQRRTVASGDPLKRWLHTAGAVHFDAKSRIPVLSENGEPVVELNYNAIIEGMKRGIANGT